jgi:hypothetical protein
VPAATFPFVKARLLRGVLILALCSYVAPRASAQDAPPYKEWGPQFNTPGAQLTIKEVQRGKLEGVTIVSYNFSAQGLPKDKAYKFWVWELGRDPQIGVDVHLGDDGSVDAGGGPFMLKVFGVPAEPMRFALVSSEAESRVFGEVIPFPIESVDGSCRLTVKMIAPLYEFVSIHAEGMKPDEDFHWTTQSYREGGRFDSKADSRGQWNILVAPFVKGKKKGFTTVELSTSTCRLKVTFPWGVHYYQ